MCGINPLSVAFNKLLFDYVYVLLEPLEEAEKQINLALEKYIKIEKYCFALDKVQ